MEKAFPSCKTKIVCTIGPASRSRDVLRELITAGMNVARLNLSHGDTGQHVQDIAAVREVSREFDANVAVLADLPGPKMRIGTIQGGSCVLERCARVVLTPRRVEGTCSVIPVQLPELHSIMEPGHRVFLSDGFIELHVLEKSGEDVVCRVAMGGELRSNKGMNLPDASLELSAVTDEDLEFIAFGIEQGVDMFGLSFVGAPEDIARVRAFGRKLGRELFVLAKIERRAAVENSREIIRAADAVMVARGDLGVEIPIQRVPIVQKQLVLEANLAAKPVITATQMLESMTGNTRPTRAEVTDAANAVFDGTDAVMLSEETAIGRYPVQACRMLSSIAEAAEAGRSLVVSGTVVPETIKRIIESQGRSIKESLSINVIRSIMSLDIRCVVVPSRTGLTARMISRLKGDAWVLALCPDDAVLKRLSLSAGVAAIPQGDLSSDADIIRYVRSRGYVSKDETFILVRREPCGDLGDQSSLKVVSPP
jgi:pyruvate kinase